jgi:hypothetical protein
MVYFQKKNPNLGTFGKGLAMEDILAYFMDIWSILQPFGILYRYLVYFVVIWYIFHVFGMLYQEKSGNRVTFFVVFFGTEFSVGFSFPDFAHSLYFRRSSRADVIAFRPTLRSS